MKKLKLTILCGLMLLAQSALAGPGDKAYFAVFYNPSTNSATGHLAYPVANEQEAEKLAGDNARLNGLFYNHYPFSGKYELTRFPGGKALCPTGWWAISGGFNQPGSGWSFGFSCGAKSFSQAVDIALKGCRAKAGAGACGGIFGGLFDGSAQKTGGYLMEDDIDKAMAAHGKPYKLWSKYYVCQVEGEAGFNLRPPAPGSCAGLN